MAYSEATLAAMCCGVDGCDRKGFGAGYCQRHYYRLRRYGDPLASAPPRPGALGISQGCEEHGGSFMKGCPLCQAQIRIYSRARRKTNPESAREYNAKSYRRNIEKRKAEARAHRERNGTAQYERDISAVDNMATRKWAKWTAEEDRLVLDPELSVAQVAVSIGRTYEAVTTRRKNLRRELDSRHAAISLLGSVLKAGWLR